MTKQEKIALVEELTERFKQYPNFYFTETQGMTVAEINDLRRLCFEEKIEMTMIKNTLIRKALENLEDDYSEVYDSLKLPTSVLFADAENPSQPAKLLKKYREGKEKPVLKAACIQASVFVGDENLETLTKLKSKAELIGEIIGLLQSPPKSVISALQSGGNKLAGIIKTLSEREEA